MEAQTDIFKANVLLSQQEDELHRLRVYEVLYKKEVQENERLRNQVASMADDLARLRRIEEALIAIRDASPQSYDWYQAKARAALADQGTKEEA